MLSSLRLQLKPMKALAAVLAVLVPLQAMPQSPREPDILIEAAMYEARAREQKACFPEDAEHWCRKAIERARQFRSPDRVERDMAGAFVGRAEMLLIEIRDRRKMIRDVNRQLIKMLNDDRLQSARRLLAENNGLACHPEIRSLQTALDAREAKVQSLAEQGDRWMRANPSEALRFYRQAQKADREHPLLAEKIREAEQSRRMHRGGSAGKAIIAGLVLAAAGGAAYYEYQRQQRFRPRHR